MTEFDEITWAKAEASHTRHCLDEVQKQIFNLNKEVEAQVIWQAKEPIKLKIAGLRKYEIFLAWQLAKTKETLDNMLKGSK